MTTQNRSKKTLTEQLVEAEARVETIKQRIAAEALKGIGTHDQALLCKPVGRLRRALRPSHVRPSVDELT